MAFPQSRWAQPPGPAAGLGPSGKMRLSAGAARLDLDDVYRGFQGLPAGMGNPRTSGQAAVGPHHRTSTDRGTK